MNTSIINIVRAVTLIVAFAYLILLFNDHALAKNPAVESGVIAMLAVYFGVRLFMLRKGKK